MPVLGGVTGPSELALTRCFAGVEGAEERVTGAMTVCCSSEGVVC